MSPLPRVFVGAHLQTMVTAPDVSRSRPIDVSRVRHPRERRIVVLSAGANALIVAGAVAVVLLAPGWLSAHPNAAQLVKRIELVAVAAVFVVPVFGFLRLGRWTMIHLNSVRLGKDQLPELHAILERHCRKLGMPEPALYVSAVPSVGLSDAIALGRRGARAIVLGEKLFDGVSDLRQREDVFAFVIGHELGRIWLGHASWRSELLLGYLKRIPVLRLPLVTVETYSRDRMAALLAPGSVSAIALSASGGEVFDAIDVEAYVARALVPVPHPWQARIAAMMRKEPHLSDRVRELYLHGFFQPTARASRASGARHMFSHREGLT